MLVDRDLLRRANLPNAVAIELSSRNRLLPRRWDYEALALDPAAVANWLGPQLCRSRSGRTTSVILADKGWRGARPLHVMTLEDRVLYRVLVDLISEALPERLRSRIPFQEFRNSPLEVPDTKYVSKTDVTSYYEFVDHELLRTELVAQTGEELVANALVDLLACVLGRRVGLPQVHRASDVLGDSYIDPARRRLLRRGHAVFTYSDDFRIASRSLGDARVSLEACALETRALGLVLNDRKTYTYGAENYKNSLTSFAEAEQRLFADSTLADSFSGLAFLDSDYDDQVEDDAAAPLVLGASALDRTLDEDEALTTDDDEVAEDIDPQRLRAAERAWALWENEDESEETQAAQDAAITQSLLGRALPTLGAANDSRPLNALSQLLRFEPALTPQVAAYLVAFCQNGQSARAQLRRALDETVADNILSPWQKMWLAQVAGGIRRARRKHSYEDWLLECTTDHHDGVAATTAAALGRIGRSGTDQVAAAVDRVGPEWRRLAFWGLIGLDRSKAESTTDDELDRLLLEATIAR